MSEVLERKVLIVKKNPQKVTDIYGKTKKKKGLQMAQIMHVWINLFSEHASWIIVRAFLPKTTNEKKPTRLA